MSNHYAITPTSSQEDGNRNSPGRTKSWNTKSGRKPWLNSPDDNPNGGHNPPFRSNSDNHVLHTPQFAPKQVYDPKSKLTMPYSPGGGDDSFMDNFGEPAQSFDDLWDESVHAGDPAVVTPNPPLTPKSAPIPNTAASKSPELDTSRFAKKKASEQPRPSGELDTNRSAKKQPELDTSKFAKPALAPATAISTAQQFAKDNDRKPSATTAMAKPAAAEKRKPSLKKPPPNPKEMDTSKFAKSPKTPTAAATATAKKRGSEIDTPKYAKGSRAPPNTPVSVSLSDRKKNPIKHPRKPKRSSQKKPSPKSGDSKKKPAAAGAPGDAAALQKQLDRVTFLQKRQFDQLSSLKKMLLQSRTKEKESVKSSEEWQTKAEINDEKLASLQKHLDQSQNELHLSKQKLKRAQSTSAALAVGGTAAGVGVGAVDARRTAELEDELAEKDARIAQLEQQIERKQQQAAQNNGEEVVAQLQAKQDKIAELELRLQEMEGVHKEETVQLQNSMEITESKLRKKIDQMEKVHVEMDEMREQLTTANSSIEQLEEERNYSRAKMAELQDMVSSKGGISDTDKELMDRAAEISNLTAKLGTAEGKVHDRDDKIFKVEETLKSINDLVKQLSDCFVAEDEEAKKNQEVLLESAESPSQASSLLLMTMMNMLDSLKAKMVTLQKERDDMNAKASDRGIQLAESHIRVDKLRTELRRMRAERERAMHGRGRGRGRGAPGRGQPAGRGLPNGRGQPNGGRGQQAPRHPSHQNGTQQGRGGQGRGWNATSANNVVMNNQSEKDRMAISTRSQPAAPAPQQNRFMNFLRGNLTQESAGQGKPQDQNSRPVAVQM